jgi:hypothetical protein
MASSLGSKRIAAELPEPELPAKRVRKPPQNSLAAFAAKQPSLKRINLPKGRRKVALSSPMRTLTPH